MFLYDPVAGSKNEFQPAYKHDGTVFKVNYTKLPKVVNDFTGLFQTNMSGFAHNNFFNSSMPAKGEMRGEYTVFQMPGGHNGACKYNMSNEGTNIGRIGLHMAYTFLKDRGSRFTETRASRRRRSLEAYAVARNPQRNEVKRKADGTFYNSKNQQAVASSRSYGLNKIREMNGVGEHPFFVNKHHYDTFRGLFPIMANFIMVSKALSGEYLQRLALGGYKETLATLIATGIAKSG